MAARMRVRVCLLDIAGVGWQGGWEVDIVLCGIEVGERRGGDA